jgi:hypothetical protein
VISIKFKRYILVLLFLNIVFIVACNNESVDYSLDENWLKSPQIGEKKVDVFYLYPTAWQKEDKKESNICKIDNEMMRNNAKIAFSNQASVFETMANIYSPYYRQVDAKYFLNLSKEEQNKILAGISKRDVFEAFEYYINNYNNGRPFILAGHSQGSNQLLFLLSDYMKENPEIYKRMIAAYIIGYSVTEEFMTENSHLKFAEGEDDIGVIISYNTEMEGVIDNPVVLPKALVINPINWSREEKYAKAKENLGSLLMDKKNLTDIYKNKEIVKNYADAKIDKDRGVLICSSVDIDKYAKGDEIFKKGILHRYDYPLYYMNLRENAINRTQKYLETN